MIIEVPVKDEAVFINAQYIGIFTGILGLAILISLSLFSPLWAIKKGIVTVCAVTGHSLCCNSYLLAYN